MEKVKVSRAIAEAIEYITNEHSNADIIEGHVHNSNGWHYITEPLNGLKLDKLIKILYYGYEIELTPEEKVQELYNEWMDKQEGAFARNDKYNHEKYLAKMSGAYEVLNLLGIKIYGINMDDEE